MTGIGLVLSRAFNRLCEPMACSPTDALDRFHESGPQFLLWKIFWCLKNECGWQGPARAPGLSWV